MVRLITIIISCLLLVVVKVQGQELTFISPLVEEGIRKQLNLAEEEQISFLQLDTITTLNLSRRGITDIRDIVLMPKLRTLDLSDNQIEDLRPLAVLDSLEWLDLRYNSLKGINELYYSSAKDLTINVSFNYIKDFSLFAYLSSCNFTLLGTGLQYSENPIYFEINSFYADINDDEQPVVNYRGYTNMTEATYLTCRSTSVSAQLDGNTYQVGLAEDITETAQVTISNGEESKETYVVPVTSFQVDAGQTIILETGLPDDYELSYALTTAGKAEIVGNAIQYTAPDRILPDVIYFCYYKNYSLKGYSRFYINRDAIETVPIKIGSNGKTTYTGDKDLDFSFSDEVKAFIATGFDKTEGIIWMTRVKDVPAGVPVMIKGTADETYNVPIAESSASYYKNMFKGNISGETVVINATEENEELGTLQNYYMSKGQFVSVNGTAKIGNNKCYLQLPANFEAEAQGADQSVKIASTGKSSFAAPVDLDFTELGEDLKAFTATGYDANTKTVWLTRVKKVQKGEGLMLKGTGGETYTIPSSGVQASYVNMIVGNTSGDGIEIGEKSDDGLLTNYYLKGGTYMSVSVSANIGNNKSYLQLPTSMLAGARSEEAADMQSEYSLAELETEPMPLILAETTGIESMDNGKWIMDNEAGAQWYSLDGRRISQPTKPGLYIRDGKKVVIK